MRSARASRLGAGFVRFECTGRHTAARGDARSNRLAIATSGRSAGGGLRPDLRRAGRWRGAPHARKRRVIEVVEGRWTELPRRCRRGPDESDPTQWRAVLLQCPHRSETRNGRRLWWGVSAELEAMHLAWLRDLDCHCPADFATFRETVADPKLPLVIMTTQPSLIYGPRTSLPEVSGTLSCAKKPCDLVGEGG